MNLDTELTSLESVRPPDERPALTPIGSGATPDDREPSASSL